jgi:hypothetical protein
MAGFRILRRTVVAVAIAATTLVASTSIAMANGYHTGSLTCSPSYRFVAIWSRSSVNVWHNWKNGHTKYYAPYRELKTSYTSYNSTWWAVEYDFETDGGGAYCTT